MLMMDFEVPQNRNFEAPRTRKILTVKCFASIHDDLWINSNDLYDRNTVLTYVFPKNRTFFYEFKNKNKKLKYDYKHVEGYDILINKDGFKQMIRAVEIDNGPHGYLALLLRWANKIFYTLEYFHRTFVNKLSLQKILWGTMWHDKVITMVVDDVKWYYINDFMPNYRQEIFETQAFSNSHIKTFYTLCKKKYNCSIYYNQKLFNKVDKFATMEGILELMIANKNMQGDEIDYYASSFARWMEINKKPETDTILIKRRRKTWSTINSNEVFTKFNNWYKQMDNYVKSIENEQEKRTIPYKTVPSLQGLAFKRVLSVPGLYKKMMRVHNYLDFCWYTKKWCQDYSDSLSVPFACSYIYKNKKVKLGTNMLYPNNFYYVKDIKPKFENKNKNKSLNKFSINKRDKQMYYLNLIMNLKFVHCTTLKSDILKKTICLKTFLPLLDDSFFYNQILKNITLYSRCDLNNVLLTFYNQYLDFKQTM
ncbi:hypothetical protein [Lambdina fiscellaria nucleopolyhedrovirus]|uniref:Uncharacterized protein n=1 Tax=Lambdina fiscellaria nucleopolyhedrovirus TaxID=1642929 RepID=A0A0E3Z6U4_9ABAC|nr:hypothetical protein [Lambdina fiscellaria nucleopolyhedrovirus]AKC91738.1 hypothetical protein [Lambdina fiscellaria nucleopolyhedrovirus]